MSILGPGKEGRGNLSIGRVAVLAKRRADSLESTVSAARTWPAVLLW